MWLKFTNAVPVRVSIKPTGNQCRYLNTFNTEANYNEMNSAQSSSIRADGGGLHIARLGKALFSRIFSQTPGSLIYSVFLSEVIYILLFINVLRLIST